MSDDFYKRLDEKASIGMGVKKILSTPIHYTEDGLIKLTPMDVVCPKCRAAIGAKCTIPIKDGCKYVDTFCDERVQKGYEL